MKLDLRPALAAARLRLAPALAFLRARRFWVESAAVTLAVAVAAYLVGASAQGRAAALEREAARLEQVGGAMDRWVRELQPPTPQESVAWRESEEALARLGGQAVTPLAVSHLLAQRAEEVGIRNLGIRLASEDSVTVPVPVSVGRWEVRAGDAAVVAEFSGDWASVIGFLGVLPPQVEVADVRVSEAEGRLRARFLLLTRHVVLQE